MNPEEARNSKDDSHACVRLDAYRSNFSTHSNNHIAYMPTARRAKRASEGACTALTAKPNLRPPYLLK